MGRMVDYDLGNKAWPKDYGSPPREWGVVTEFYDNGSGTYYKINGLDGSWRESDLCTHEEWHADHKPPLTPRVLVAGDELVINHNGDPCEVFTAMNEALVIINKNTHRWVALAEYATPAFYSIARTGQPLAAYLAGEPEPPELPLLLLGGRLPITLAKNYSVHITAGEINHLLPKEMNPGDRDDFYFVTKREIEQLMRR